MTNHWRMVKSKKKGVGGGGQIDLKREPLDLYQKKSARSMGSTTKPG